MNPSAVQSVLALLLVAAFAWSGSVFGLDCICEVAAGSCTDCCGLQVSGHKHCSKDKGPIIPPAVMNSPTTVNSSVADKVQTESAKKTDVTKKDKQGKVNATDKPAIVDKALKNTGKNEK